MSIALLDRVSAHLAFSGLEDGFTIKKHRWSDKDIEGKNQFIVYRQDGGGTSNVLLQEIDVLIQLSVIPADLDSGDTRMQEIVAAFRDSSVTTGIIRFDLIGEVSGPFFLENGRPLWELVVRCFVEDL